MAIGLVVRYFKSGQLKEGYQLGQVGRFGRREIFGLVIAFISGLSILASACGGTAAAQEINVTLDDYFVRSSAASVAVGDVTLVAKNEAAQEHELVIIKTDLAPNALRTGDGGVVDEEGSGQAIGEIEDVEAGKSKKGTFKLSAGKYILICNLPGHYLQGMAVALEAK